MARSSILAPLVLLSFLFGPLAAALTVQGTILVLARNNGEAYAATSGLDAHGIPYSVIVVPQSGVTLPTLSACATAGDYGGIITVSELAYEYDGGVWGSAITDAQWEAMYAYQEAFGVRMVRLDAYPQPKFGTTTAGPNAGCCADGVTQNVSFNDTTDFPTAGLVQDASLSMDGLWHYNSIITNSTLAKAVAVFAPDSAGQFTSETVGAVINNFGKREQFVWFTSWGNAWSQTSNFLQHAHINWLTRGLYVGRRRIYFNTQIDDVLLSTEIYQPDGEKFRCRTTDLEAHVAWQADMNSRMPTGSNYIIEMGYNGNGNIEASTVAEENSTTQICSPDTAIYYDYPESTPLEFVKPLGSGTSVWPNTPSSYAWSLQCTKIDPLSNWFQTASNRDNFHHISHTFTHLNLNNATYSDVSKEISFNQAYLAQVGLAANNFSPHGLIPPAISGMHNGDALRAWYDNGITEVVGDSSRPLTRNQDHEYWPYITSTNADGYSGMTVLPRWPVAMYYNCYDLPCTSAEWVATSGGWGDEDDLLEYSRTTYTRHLLALRHDGFMFHQANLRHGDTPSKTVAGRTDNFSLLQIWVELIVAEMSRLTTWPLVSIKQDDLATQFRNRMAADKCAPEISWTVSNDVSAITAVTLTALDKSCSVPIPVTFPVTASASCSGCTESEQLGDDPLTLWTQMSGSQVSFSLSTPINI